MSYSKLYQKDSYIESNVNYVTSSFIREYDISKANISILYKYGGIDINTYNRLYRLPGLQRSIQVGLMCRDDQDLNTMLTNGFVESRRLFFEANDIQDHEILSIKKDAIFLINKVAGITEFDGVNFINKNIYTSFYKVGNLEFYYYSDVINNIDTLHIKGIDDNILYTHEPFMLDFLKYIFELAETSAIDEVVSTISNFYREYIDLKLPIGYYRELNSVSKFNLNSNTIVRYYLDHLPETFDKGILVIGCNRDIIRTLYSYYSNMHLQNR